MTAKEILIVIFKALGLSFPSAFLFIVIDSVVDEVQEVVVGSKVAIVEAEFLIGFSHFRVTEKQLLALFTGLLGYLILKFDVIVK